MLEQPLKYPLQHVVIYIFTPSLYQYGLKVWQVSQITISLKQQRHNVQPEKAVSQADGVTLCHHLLQSLIKEGLGIV